ncbi:MAG: LysR family transcriptional regulator [Rhizobiales bacterium]|nr:LysR family transcriptional regulator [Hyphomicrobiales bacterium]
MDLRHITAFVAAYEEGSINRAAQRLNLAQPSVSGILRDLEAEIGGPLFERLARGARPTSAGDTFYKHCLRVLAEVDAARKSVVSGVDRIAGPVHIGLAPTVAKGLMPRFIAGYLADYPDVQLRIAEAFSGPLAEWTLSGDVDFAVVAVPPADRRLVIRRLAPDPIFLISAPGGLAATSSGPLSAMPPLKLVLPSPRNGLRTMLDRYIHAANLPVERLIEIDSLHGILEVVKRSDWVTLLSITSILKELERGELAARRTDPPVDLEFYLVHPARRALSAAAALFVQRLEQAFAESQAEWAPLVAGESGQPTIR